MNNRFNNEIKILDRAEQLNLIPNANCEDRMTLACDLHYARDEFGNKLDVANLASFDDENFCHDIYGICANIHRDSDVRLGRMDNFFSPRCGFEKT